MLTTRPIKRRFGGNICRDCINREYHTVLEREDVFHKESEELCPYCCSTHRVVSGFKPSGMWKMLFKH